MSSVASKGKKRRRKFKLPKWTLRPLLFFLTFAMNRWMVTLNLRMSRYDPGADPGDDAYTGSVLYVFWHEYILLPLYLRPNSRLTILISQHQDAEAVNYVAQSIGMDVIRGSTFRGAANALRQMILQGSQTSLAIVPDGPRGPRRKLAQGCIYLSSRLQIPIVPIGVGFDRPWRMQRAWDKFAIPRPFSRARLILGPKIQVPADLARGEIELHRQWIEQKLSELTHLSEEWAENRCSIQPNELLYRHGPKQLKNAPQQLFGPGEFCRQNGTPHRSNAESPPKDFDGLPLASSDSADGVQIDVHPVSNGVGISNPE